MAGQQSTRLSLTTKIGFGMGDIYGGGSMLIVGSLYLIFLTDVVRLNPALAGVVLLLSKGWDAVSDPLMGVLSDRTRTRYGRRRPYFLLGVVLIFLSFVLLWTPVHFRAEAARFAFVLFAYLFFSTIITMVMIPYNALAAELTLDYRERSSLVSIRMAFSMGSTLVCAVVPLAVVNALPTKSSGYALMGAIFGLFFALPYIATFLTTRERPEFQMDQPRITLRTFIEPFKVRAFRNVLFMYLFSFLAIDIVEAIIIYFMTYYIGRGGETNLMLGTLLILQLLSIPAFTWLTKRRSKRAAFITGASIWLLLALISFLIVPGLTVYLYYLFAGLVGIGMGGVIVSIYSIFPDIPDVDELVTGVRREGIYSGMTTFFRKLSSALALFLLSQAIALSGYLPPVEQAVNGLTKSVPQTQPYAFILVLRLLFALLPAILVGICLISALRYPLSPALHEELKTLLTRRREAAGGLGDEGSDEDRAEAARLRRILVEGI
ncbi:MAG TPA: MFS transporter [Spirochaetia bacterium]|nr:MFS transporter [Spirochaetia bacterium]